VSMTLVLAIAPLAALFQLLVGGGIAWLFLRRWLNGRSLIIASTAVSGAFALGAISNAQLPSDQIPMALYALALIVVLGFLMGNLWLRRYEARTGADHG
jgi:hypothetical protein